MLDVYKYAAIDIGSNAVRLLISDVINNPKTPLGWEYKKISLIRVPIRLGEDVFLKGIICDEKKERFLNAMKAFKYLILAHDITCYMGCATSAFRESSNGLDIINLTNKETELNIEIIDGKKEAAIIYSTQISEIIKPIGNYLYVDVGGGSTEISLFSNGKILDSMSFNIGTVRILHHLVENHAWNYLSKWLTVATRDLKNIIVIGSGGNINKLVKLIDPKRKNGDFVSLQELDAIYLKLCSLTYEDRIRELSLKSDRSDVIIPASQIYLMIMKKISSEKIIIPKIGLADGIIRHLHQNNLKKIAPHAAI